MSTRKAELTEIGARLASKHGVENVTRRMVAKEAGVSDALVSNYLGTVEEQRAAYKRRARTLGLKLPDAEASRALGLKLRAHGPRDKRDTRKRSAREVEAIKRKREGVAKKSESRAVIRTTSASTAGKSGAAKKSVGSSTLARKSPTQKATATVAPHSVKVPIARLPEVAKETVRSAARPPKSEPLAIVPLPVE